MLSLPEAYELVGFFESEPKLADPGVPWCYNHLSFSLKRDQDHVACELEPATGEIDITWHQAGRLRSSIKLNNLTGLAIHVAKDDEHMIAAGSGASANMLLKLRLKPYVSVELECLLEV